MKTRYRNKLNKIIVELEYLGKWYYIKTLPDPFVLFKKECLEKVSLLQAQNIQIKPESQPNVRTTFINSTFGKDISPAKKTRDDAKNIKEVIELAGRTEKVIFWDQSCDALDADGRKESGVLPKVSLLHPENILESVDRKDTGGLLFPLHTPEKILTDEEKERLKRLAWELSL